MPSFLSCLSSDHLEEVYFHNEADPEVDWDLIDWHLLDGALSALHKRCPALIVTFHFYGVIPMGYAKPDVVAPLEKRVPLALLAGMRIASVLSAMTFRPLNDDNHPIEMGFIVEPEERHWLTLAE